MRVSIKYLALFLTGCVMSFCGSEPGLLDKEFRPKGERISIAYLRSLFVTVPVVVEKEVYIEGYVVSDDAFGNFHNTLVIEDETGGIIVMADMDRLCDFYPHHNKVIVNCNSLTVGSYGGLVEIGVSSGGTMSATEPIPEELIRSVIVRTGKSGEPRKPSSVTIDGLSPRYLSCYVRFEGVQFTDAGQGLTWSESDSDTNRMLTDRKGNTLPVRTSRKARFAGHRLPAGSGTIDGILGYFNGQYQLSIIRPEHADMEGERFVPVTP